MSNQASHLYFDLNIYNYDPDGSTPPKMLNYIQINPQDFITDPSQYYLSIIRFSIENFLPVFIPQIKLGQSDINLTIYTITMTYQCQGYSYKYSIDIEYESLNPTYTPNTPTTTQDYSSPYYYVYTYQQFIDTVNSHLQACFVFLVQTVQSQQPAGTNLPVPNNTENSPFVVFDPSSYMCQFNADQQYFDEAIIDTSTVPAMRVYFNSPLMKLFRSFPARCYR